LRVIEKDKLSALEYDKQRELKRLAAERERIRLEEQALLDEV
jgi:adenylate kinase